MVGKTVPRHLYFDYSSDFGLWLKNDFEINKKWYNTINDKYDRDNAKKTFKSIITKHKKRFIDESNSYSYFKIKYGNIKKIDNDIIDLTIDYLITDFETNYN
jgi:hypothetical protein